MLGSLTSELLCVCVHSAVLKSIFVTQVSDSGFHNAAVHFPKVTKNPAGFFTYRYQTHTWKNTTLTASGRRGHAPLPAGAETS